MGEVAIKLVAIALARSLLRSAPEYAYRLSYEILRADGLGTWDQAIRTATNPPVVSFQPQGVFPLIAWATKNRTKPEDDWYRDATSSLETIFALLDLDDPIFSRKPSVRDFISALVQLRNKTKAHGAVGPNFFREANAPFTEAVAALVNHCPLFDWPWLLVRGSFEGEKSGLWLRGLRPDYTDEDRIKVLSSDDGTIVFWPPEETHPIDLGGLLEGDVEATEFLLPNGGYTDSGSACFLNYLKGRERSLPREEYRRPPAPLPKSETEGLGNLTVHSNVFGNLPPLPSAYVSRSRLESALLERLEDRNHPIITLHGRGGIGKTTLALKVAHEIAKEPAEPLYDQIVWFSARDVDLELRGPKAVTPAITSLEAAAESFGTLFSRGTDLMSFAEALRTADDVTGRGTLFVFDNFETMTDARGVHEFLDTHTHLPNKVLITSRERAFKADFPIEVTGMAEAEATAMMRHVARELRIEALATDENLERIFEYAEGHPYVMKILVGEMAKDGRYVPPKTVVPRRLDILDAVFERSFKKLSPAGRWVFLLVSNWRSAIAETALIVVLAEQNLDASEGVDECERLSLINQLEYLDGRRAFVAPQVARVFGQKKLEGDPDHLLIQEDLQILRQFGVLPAGEPIQVPEETSLVRFGDWALENDHDDSSQVDALLVTLSELWPKGWVYLAKFRQAFQTAGSDGVEYALRRAVEENPGDKDTWLARAEFARQQDDDQTFIASSIRASELDPQNISLLRDVAWELCRYVSDHSDDIPVQRRSVYLASVRDNLESVSEQLDADGLSRLAWLYLLEGNQEFARKHASRGLEIDPDNVHCYRLIERLRT